MKTNRCEESSKWDDTAIIQWHINNGVRLPPRAYVINGDIKSGGTLFLESGVFEFCGTGSMRDVSLEGSKKCLNQK